MFGIDIFGAFSDGLQWLVRVVLESILQGLEPLFAVGIESYLFFENPVELAALTAVWETSVVVFLAVMAVGFLQHCLVVSTHLHVDGIAFQRLLERGLVAGLVVAVSRPFVGLVVAFVHALTALFYRTPFELDWGIAILERIMASVGLFVAVPIGTFSTLLLVVFGLGLLFLFVVRMFAVYVLYALVPLLLALWVFDVGPMGVLTDLADDAIRLTALLVLYGPLAAAFLWIGATLGDFAAVESTGGTFGVAAVSGETDVASLANALGDLFALLASIGAVLALGVAGVLSVLR